MPMLTQIQMHEKIEKAKEIAKAALKTANLFEEKMDSIQEENEVLRSEARWAIGACGMPDASEACRTIQKRLVKALEGE